MRTSNPIGKCGYTTQTNIADHILWCYYDELQQLPDLPEHSQKTWPASYERFVGSVLADYDWIPEKGSKSARFNRRERVQNVVKKLIVNQYPYGKDSIYTSETDICFHILAKHAKDLQKENLVSAVMKEYNWKENGVLSASRRKRIEDAIKRALFCVKIREAVQLIEGGNAPPQTLSQEEKTTLQDAVALNIISKEHPVRLRICPSDCSVDDLACLNRELEDINVLNERRQQQQQQLLKKWIEHERARAKPSLRQKTLEFALTEQKLPICRSLATGSLEEICHRIIQILDNIQDLSPIDFRSKDLTIIREMAIRIYQALHPETEKTSLETQLATYLGPLERITGSKTCSVMEEGKVSMTLPASIMGDVNRSLPTIELYNASEGPATIMEDCPLPPKTNPFESEDPDPHQYIDCVPRPTKTYDSRRSYQMTSPGRSDESIPQGRVAIIREIDLFVKNFSPHSQEAQLLRNAILFCCDQSMFALLQIKTMEHVKNQYIPTDSQRKVTVHEISPTQIEIHEELTFYSFTSDPGSPPPPTNQTLTVKAKFVLRKQDETWKLEGPYYENDWFVLQDKPEAAAAAPQAAAGVG